MTALASSWLPRGAIMPDRLEPQLATLAARWGEHWLTSGEASIASLCQDDWPGLQSTRWRALGCAAITLTPAAECAMASAMLGRPVVQQTLQPNDRALVERLADSCADDLLRRIASAVGDDPAEPVQTAPPELSGCSWWQLSLSRSRHLFRLALCEQSAVRLVKSALGLPRSRPVPGIRAALAGQALNLTLDLGRCAITLAELEDLGPGDLLILDRSTEAALDLLIDGQQSTLSGHLETNDGAASLILAPRK